MGGYNAAPRMPNEAASSPPRSPTTRELRHALESERLWQTIPDEALANLKHYLMFVGTARSGHSVFGAILDAHPNMVIANELHALALFQQHGFDRQKVFKMILAGAIRRDEAGRWNNTGYDYNVAGLFQGRYQQLEVLGDKKAGQSSMWTLRHPELPKRMLQLLGPMLKVILVLRNPFDSISAMAHHRGKAIGADEIKRYFRRLDGALLWKQALPAAQFLAVRHEQLIADKRGTISRLCDFVGQHAAPEYIDACAAMIYDSPNKRRHSVTWSDADRQSVNERINAEPYRQVLAGYEF